MKLNMFAGLAALLFSANALAAPPSMKMWRLDCGEFQANASTFDDKIAKPGPRVLFTDSCYLIQHGQDLLLWDTGFSTALLDAPLSASAPVSPTLHRAIVAQLQQIGFKPADVTIVALSHFHSDHTGQAASFPQARLLLGKADAELMKRSPAPFFVEPAQLEHWLGGQGVLDEVQGDRDVFGDGTVTMIALPGHTPGNHGLLVKLPKDGAFLISGDALHFTSQMAKRAVPPVNPDREATLASYDRISTILKQAHAKLVIQHEPADIGEIPAFPAYAR